MADESVDRQIVDRLRKGGHFLWYIAEMEPGIPDEAVFELANRENAVLLTADKDFGEIVFRQRRLTTGVVLVRLAGLPPMTKAHIVASTIEKHAAELPEAFAVITPSGVRIRRRVI